MWIYILNLLVKFNAFNVVRVCIKHVMQILLRKEINVIFWKGLRTAIKNVAAVHSGGGRLSLLSLSQAVLRFSTLLLRTYFQLSIYFHGANNAIDFHCPYFYLRRGLQNRMESLLWLSRYADGRIEGDDVQPPTHRCVRPGREACWRHSEPIVSFFLHYIVMCQNWMLLKSYI